MPDGSASTALRGLGVAAPAAPAILPLRAQGLVFEVAGQRLIDGVDLTLEAGRRTIVMGANGAGKSLLLRLLHGLLRPTQGGVRWRGRIPDRSVARRQAMVFQRPVLLRRSVGANIRYALSVAGVPRDECERRLVQVLKLARLEHLEKAAARVLSGGEQQRLAMARALATRPDILFLDEPTASLDPASTLAVEQLVQTAHETGTKIVLVTHNVGQARRLADEVVFLHRGRVVEHTAADAFFERPQSDAAAAFLAGRIHL